MINSNEYLCLIPGERVTTEAGYFDDDKEYGSQSSSHDINAGESNLQRVRVGCVTPVSFKVQCTDQQKSATFPRLATGHSTTIHQKTAALASTTLYIPVAWRRPSAPYPTKLAPTTRSDERWEPKSKRAAPSMPTTPALVSISLMVERSRVPQLRETRWHTIIRLPSCNEAGTFAKHGKR